jgi:hypothetical protein
MTASRVHGVRGVAVGGRALAYAPSADGYRVAFPTSEVVGGAKLYTTVEDLLRWDRNFHDATVGSRALMDRMPRSYTPEVQYGWPCEGIVAELPVI